MARHCLRFFSFFCLSSAMSAPRHPIICSCLAFKSQTRFRLETPPPLCPRGVRRHSLASCVQFILRRCVVFYLDIPHRNSIELRSAGCVLAAFEGQIFARVFSGRGLGPVRHTPGGGAMMGWSAEPKPVHHTCRIGFLSLVPFVPLSPSGLIDICLQASQFLCYTCC